MHLMFENVLKNLLLLWTGNYKGLDTGTGEYQLNPSVLDAIGAASAGSGDTIPSAFGPRSPNMANDKTSWTADSLSFWSLYVAPVVLQGRFLHRRYYNHFVRLVKLIHLCLAFEITIEEIDELRRGFVDWVKDYEKIYYQYDPERLSTCPVTIHALLHIADSIVWAGPVWTSWAFPMERYCGSLQGAIRSRRYPYASLNRHVLDRARLTHIKLIYNLEETLSLKPPSLHGFYRAICIPGYQTCALLPPHRTPEAGALTTDIRNKIVGALCTRFNGTMTNTRTALAAATIEEWGRFCILPEGDIIRTASFGKSTDQPTTQVKFGQAERDATFVRYEALVDRNARHRNAAVQLQRATFYGRLEHVLAVYCPPILGSSLRTSETVLFAVVRTCDIEETHSSLDIHYYSKETTLDVLDITTIQCLVGRIRDRGRCAIIDHSGALSRAIYDEDEGEED
ncbi:hypothetical protein K466DRAFT_499707 [Polyporus arcularius HHB13444]|uniref:Uncharacterized protein n=1 Tax=Polyporus arcularius HHB13444 TaxID=1314778 RepID=A0A5C3P398_9APHY|nr:hypothetical protein K466DRAFT_499707 [Polyporus arcularius HHB13444]